jgi:hypothetical protein
MYALFVRCKKEYNINEWILYHLNIGFSHIYIYDDFVTSELSVRTCIDKYIPLDKYTIIDKHMIKINRTLGLNSKLFYDEIFKIIKKKNHKYLMHIDMDEYLCLHNKFNDINQFILHYEPFDHLYINWCLYGNSNNKSLPEITNKPYTLLDKFIYSNDKLSNHGKSIVKINSLRTAYNPHFFLMKSNAVYKDAWNNKYTNLHESLFGLCNGKITANQCNLLNDMDITYIAHYVIQTTERFVKRRFSLDSGRRHALAVVTPEKINNIIDIVHDMDHDKVKTLDIPNKNKEIIKKIIIFYKCHNMNTKLNFHENIKNFISKNINGLY